MYFNEIYVRHGFLFEEEGKYWEYYNKFEWYSELEKKEVTYDMMNDFERKIIRLLVKIEKEKGYR